MEMIGLKMNYLAPQCLVVELKARQLLCTSGETNTEGFGMSSYSYSDEDWD